MGSNNPQAPPGMLKGYIISRYLAMGPCYMRTSLETISCTIARLENTPTLGSLLTIGTTLILPYRPGQAYYRTIRGSNLLTKVAAKYREPFPTYQG